MSEINAIATNNFILHNIDAKKLYVQEPLFTANSGDAVYVGWRPDETVLWSGNLSSKNTEITLLDSLKNYNSYKIYGYNTENKYGVVSEFTYNSAGPNWFSITNTRIQDNGYLTIYGSYVSANTDWNKLNITYMSNKYCISGGLTHSTGYGVGITKIVGINRISGGNA
jgi:hypothetical protein